MFKVKKPGGPQCSPGRFDRTALGTLLIAVASLAAVVACSNAVAAPTGTAMVLRSHADVACRGSAVVAVTAPQHAVEEVGVDLSASTTGSSLRSLYTVAVQAIVVRAASESALLRVVPFGPSGVGAQPVFQGSFAATGDGELFNLAASNRARCLAERQVASLARVNGAGRDRGTDVAGTLGALIGDARSVVTGGARVTVTLTTDGCQAPATAGLNRQLTDLCGTLAAGTSAAAILAAHPGEFSLPNATGVTVVMRGIGVGGRPQAASTRLAGQLVAFWTSVCRRAHAAACLIGSDLP